MDSNFKLFLEWFFSGAFFKSLKEKIENEIDQQRSDFATVFFDNNQDFIEWFIRNDVPKLKKGYIKEEHINYINRNELKYIKNILIGIISFSNDPLLSISARLENRTIDIAVKNFFLEQYKKFRVSKRCVSYVKSLNGEVCRYCDKGVIDCTDSHFYGDLDHVHDKSTHYYYALNIFNLTPCCKVCNQKKGKRNVLFNPLELSLDDVFTFYIEDSDLITLSTRLNIQDNINVKLREKGDEMSPILHDLNNKLALDDRYKNSGLIVEHLSQLKRVYTREYITSVLDLLGDNYDIHEIKSFLLSDYSKGHRKKIQPLTKLIRDIANQIDLLTEGNS